MDSKDVWISVLSTGRIMDKYWHEYTAYMGVLIDVCDTCAPNTACRIRELANDFAEKYPVCSFFDWLKRDHPDLLISFDEYPEVEYTIDEAKRKKCEDLVKDALALDAEFSTTRNIKDYDTTKLGFDTKTLVGIEKIAEHLLNLGYTDFREIIEEAYLQPKPVPKSFSQDDIKAFFGSIYSGKKVLDYSPEEKKTLRDMILFTLDEWVIKQDLPVKNVKVVVRQVITRFINKNFSSEKIMEELLERLEIRDRRKVLAVRKERTNLFFEDLFDDL